jgi:hypothetical protein
MKAVCGWLSHNLVRHLKTLPIYKYSFIQAMNFDEIQDRICHWFNKIPDCVAIEIDQANHDANQSSEFMDAVDKHLLYDSVYNLAREAGYAWFQIIQILQCMFSNKIPFRAYYPNSESGLKGRKKYKMFARGYIVGTTPSGHPSKTTLGNTLRIIHAMIYVAELVGAIYGETFMIFQSGDDTVLLMSRRFVKAYKAKLDELWLEDTKLTLETQIYGLGMSYKGFIVSDRKVNFLSKEIYLGPKASMVRILSRTIWTGAIMNIKKVPAAVLNWSVTKQLQSWASGFPGYDTIIEWRNKLVSSKPSNKQKKKLMDYEYINNQKYNKKYGCHYYGFEHASMTQSDLLTIGAGSTPDALHASMKSAVDDVTYANRHYRRWIANQSKLEKAANATVSSS